MGRFTSEEKRIMVRKIRSCAQCARVHIIMVMSSMRMGAQGEHNQGCEQGAKQGVRNIYTTYIGCAHPTYAEVGSRAVSSRTTTTHPATQVGTKP